MIDKNALLKQVKDAWEGTYKDAGSIDALPWINTDIPEVLLASFINRIKAKRQNGTISILDFGCGNGRIGKYIHDKLSVNVLFYDISENALNRCKDNGISQEQIICNLAECDRSFDGIIVWGVFHHMPPQIWDCQLELITNLLAPDGLLLFGDFTNEDTLFALENNRTSEVTRISSFAVDFSFIEKKLNSILSDYFEFQENAKFKSRRKDARKMKYIIAERFLVDKLEAYVRQEITKDINPVFWHFVKYSFKDSLTYPHGNAVSLFSGSDWNAARKMWQEGMSLFKRYDDVKKGGEGIFNKSLTEELFFNSSKNNSYYVYGQKSDQFSIEIKPHYYLGSGNHFDVRLNAPALSIETSKEFGETRYFNVFIRGIKESINQCKLTINENLLLDAKEKLDNLLKPMSSLPSTPLFMMLLMVWPSETFERKSFIFIQPPVFEENANGITLDVSAGGFVSLSDKEPLSHQINTLLPRVNRWASLYTTQELVKFTKKKSINAAIAQVMARNMSHNFGSHVLSKLMDNNVCKKIVSNCDITDISNYTRLFPNDSDSTPQLAHFNSYLKSRMDYLSEVTFGVSDMVTTRMIFGNVMRELDCQQLLLNHIPGIDDFNYRFEITYNSKELSCESDIAAAFPGDVLGCQAFYNIIENIIRNTAKHHKGDLPAKGVVLSINIKDIEKDHETDETDELYCVEITNGLREDGIDNLVINQNSLINASVLDKNNNLRNKALGLLEMKASAAFLRQIDMTDIDSDLYAAEQDSDFHIHDGVKHLSLLKAFKGKDNDALGYRFYIQKPKEILFIGDNWPSMETSMRRLLRTGIQFLNNNEFESAMKSGIAFEHQFLFFDSTVNMASLSNPENKTLLPLKHVPVKDEQIELLSNILTNGSNNLESILSELKEYAWNTIISGKCSFQVVVNFFDHCDEIEAYYELLDSRKCVENTTSRTKNKLPGFYKYLSLPKPANISQERFNAWNDWTRYIRRIPQYIHNEIVDAYNSKIIIIDERVQRFAEDNKEGSIPCWALFQSTNVMIPRCPGIDEKGNYISPNILTKTDGIVKELPMESSPQDSPNVFPLAPKDFSGFKDKIEKYINDNIADSYLIIHYGILERLYGRDENYITRKLNLWATGKEDVEVDSSPIIGHARRVVVTSGRGSHSLNLPKAVCFANLSSVLYTCTECRNKYLIYYLINQSRRKR